MSLLADWQLSGPLLILWPFRDDVWREQGLPAQQQLIDIYQRFSAITATVPPVLFGVHPDNLAQAKKLLPSDAGLIAIRYNDAWSRDIGPLWVRSTATQVIAHGFQFSAWHGLYPDMVDDQAFASRLAECLRLPLQTHRQFVLEGGAISTDGAGSAIVHSASVKRNNANWTLAEMAVYLHQHLNLQRILWLDFANPHDETGGHADNHAQFLAEDTIVCSLPAEDSELFAAYAAQLEKIRSWRRPNQQPYRIVILPQPEPVVVESLEFSSVRAAVGVLPRGQQPLLASYVNFVRHGNIVLLPQFGCADDQRALEILATAAPQLTILPVPVTELIKAGGAIHCMTLPLPYWPSE